jgi:ribosomal protein S18 acetylase RimI-like enzyme
LADVAAREATPEILRHEPRTPYGRPVNRDELMVDRATAADVPAAQGLIDDARRWLNARGIDQWQDPVPDTVLLRDVERGCLFVVRQDHGIAAMVTVYDSDPETWGVDATSAIYVHRLAVGRAHRGGRLGQRLLAWVDAQATDRGASFVRLDCATDNPGLRRFYEQQGFRYVRDVTVTALDGGRRLASSLYERALVR